MYLHKVYWCILYLSFPEDKLKNDDPKKIAFAFAKPGMCYFLNQIYMHVS